jgi:hypothetical protein
MAGTAAVVDAAKVDPAEDHAVKAVARAAQVAVPADLAAESANFSARKKSASFVSKKSI